MNIFESRPVVTCLHSQVYKRDPIGDRTRIRTSVLLYVQTFECNNTVSIPTNRHIYLVHL